MTTIELEQFAFDEDTQGGMLKIVEFLQRALLNCMKGLKK